MSLNVIEAKLNLGNRYFIEPLSAHRELGLPSPKRVGLRKGTTLLLHQTAKFGVLSLNIDALMNIRAGLEWRGKNTPIITTYASILTCNIPSATPRLCLSQTLKSPLGF